MNADFLKVEQAVQKAHVPVRGAAGTDVAENPGVFARHVLGAERRHGAGAHVRDGRGVENGLHHARFRIKKIHDRHFRRKILLIVVHIVAHNLHTRHMQRLNIAAQHIEMPLGGILRHEMNAGLDAGLPQSLRAEAFLHGGKDFGVRHVQAGDIGTVEIGEIAFLHDVLQKVRVKESQRGQG